MYIIYRKNTLRMLTNEEIMYELDQTLEAIEEPVPVVLGHLRCEDCGQVGKRCNNTSSHITHPLIFII